MPTATSLEVEVLKDGQKRLAGSPSAESPFKQVYVSETGQYACRLTSGDAVLSTKTVTVVPGVHIQHVYTVLHVHTQLYA